LNPLSHHITMRMEAKKKTFGFGKTKKFCS
jgi:hypothetical protein